MEKTNSAKKASVWRMLTGIVMLFGGIFALVRPLMFVTYLIWLLSVVIIVTGIAQLIGYLQIRKTSPNASVLLISAVLDILLGAVILGNNLLSAGISLVWLLGFWLFAAGIMRIVTGLTVKKGGESKWWMDLLTGLISVAAGVFLFMYPGSGLATIGLIIGAYMVIYGLFSILMFIAARKKEKKVAESNS